MSRSKTIEQAQAELATDLSESFDDPVHSHSDKIEKLAAMNYGPKSEFEEGSVVKLNGRLSLLSYRQASLCATATRLCASPPSPRSMLSCRASATVTRSPSTEESS